MAIVAARTRPVRERDAADCPRPQQLADCGGHPLLLLFIFGYGINLDSSKLRVGVLLEQQSEEALDFVHTMTGSPYIDATVSDNRQQLVQMMQAGRIRALVAIPVDFDRKMARPGDDAPISSSPTAANRIPLTSPRATSKASGKSGSSSGRKIAAKPSSRLSTCRRATGLTRPPSASILLSPARLPSL